MRTSNVVSAKLREFTRDQRGNIGILFAASMLPALMFIGLAVDYSRSAGVKTQLDTAADAAALAAVSKMWDSSDTGGVINVAARSQDARRVFTAAANQISDLTITDLNVTTRQELNNVFATVTYSADVKLAFGTLFSTTAMSFSGKAVSVKPLPPYVDFYLLLDNSPSMGLAATNADIARMNQLTGCAFACHEPNNPNDNYHIAHANGVSLRIDVLRTATQDMLGMARDTATATNQYRASIYTFENNIQQIAPLSANLNDVIAQANGIELGYPKTMDGGNNGSSELNTALNQINAVVPTPGTGLSESDRQRFVFFVSDGLNDTSAWWCTWTHCTSAVDLGVCQALKSRGVRIAVLYTTYLPMPNEAAWQLLVQPYAADIPAKMRACASSPDLFFEVGTDGHIGDAMKKMFQAAVNSTRLTQ